MAQVVKRRSVHRQRQLELTRSVILEAATELFVANGYVATTIERIAAQASVAPSTVYSTFGTKVAILAASRWHLAQAAGVVEVREAMARETSLRARIGLVAGLERRLYESGIELVNAMRVAAATDREAARDWEELTAERQTNLDATFPDLSPSARDVVRALLAPDVYIETVQRGRWSPDEYERWLSETIVRLVAATKPDVP